MDVIVNCSNLVSWVGLQTVMVLNQGIGGLKILPTLVDSLPNEAVPLSVEVNQDIYYFVEVGNGMHCLDYLPVFFFKSENNGR